MAGRCSVTLFLFNQTFYRTVGIHLTRPNPNHCSFNWKNWTLFICLGQSVSSIVAFLLLDAESVADIGMSAFFLLGLFLCSMLHLIPSQQVENTSELIDSCEAFIESRSHATIAYKEFSEQIEKFCEWFCIALFGSVAFCAFPIFIFTIINYYMSDLAEKSFYLIYPTVSFPFDWRTRFGYFAAWTSELVACFGACVALVPALSLIFASSWLFVTIADHDLTQELATFNTDVKTSAEKDHKELMRRLSDIIQAHWDAKELVNKFNAIHRFSIFLFFVWGISDICVVLLTIQFQMLDDNSKSMEIFVSSILVFWTFQIIFIICESGERISQAFERFYEELEQCDWHLLPTDLRRLYLTFLLDSQQSIHLQCYGRILCTRDTFKKITKNGFSYFATLRRIERA